MLHTRHKLSGKVWELLNNSIVVWLDRRLPSPMALQVRVVLRKNELRFLRSTWLRRWDESRKFGITGNKSVEF